MAAFTHKSNIWQPPIELQRSTPRETQFTGAGKAAVVVMIVLVLTSVAGSIALALRATADESRWKSWSAEAVSTQGEITGLRKQGSGDDTKYYVDYSYQVNGTNYAASGQARSREWRRWKRGDALEVIYRRTEPRQSWLPGHEPKGVPPFAALLFGAALLIPVPLIVHFLKRQQHLVELGRVAEATVVTVKKRSHDRGSYYAVEYEFENIAGSRRTGKFNATHKAPQIGEKLTVLYHPDEERWSARYPLSLVQVRKVD